MFSSPYLTFSESIVVVFYSLFHILDWGVIVTEEAGRCFITRGRNTVSLYS